MLKDREKLKIVWRLVEVNKETKEENDARSSALRPSTESVLGKLVPFAKRVLRML